MEKYIWIIVLLIIIIFLYIYFKKMYIHYKRKAINIIDMIKTNEEIIESTPKTLSVKESLFLDKIKTDFPELNIELSKTYVSEIITDYLKFLETGNNNELKKDCTENFLTQAESFIDHKKRTDIRFHQVLISNYFKDNDEANIVFQASCQYKVNNRLEQQRFEISYIYYLQETPENKTISLKCTNCGGPIEYTGQKICKFCGCRLIDTIKRTWKFNTIRRF